MGTSRKIVSGGIAGCMTGFDFHKGGAAVIQLPAIDMSDLVKRLADAGAIGSDPTGKAKAAFDLVSKKLFSSMVALEVTVPIAAIAADITPRMSRSVRDKSSK